MPWLAPEEGDGLAGSDGRPHNRPTVSIDAARQIDRDNRRAGRIDRLDQRPRRPLDRPVETGTEQGIDDHRGKSELRRFGGHNRPSPSLCRQGRIALEALAVADQHQPDLTAAFRQQPRSSKSIAAIIAGAGDHQNRTRLSARQDRIRDRTAGIFHELDAWRAAADGQAIGQRHLLRREKLDHATTLPVCARANNSHWFAAFLGMMLTI